MKSIFLSLIAILSLASCNLGSSNKTYTVRDGAWTTEIEIVEEADGSVNVAKVGDTIYCGWSTLEDKAIYGVIEKINQ